MIAYDLHIHSALSPCAQDEMTPNNIINMSLIKELDVIALTDHNTMLQCRTCAQCAQGRIQFIYGVEIESKEGVHLLGYFRDDSSLDFMQKWLDDHRSKIPHRADYFGNQLLMNEQDEVIGTVDELLIVSCDASIDEISAVIHSAHGLCVIAHALDRASSMITQLGFIPFEFDYDAIEVHSNEQIEMILSSHPWLKNPVFFISSDAHQLIDISEPEHFIEEKVWDELWRKRL